MKKIILIAAAVIILGVGIGLATTMVNNNQATLDQASRDMAESTSAGDGQADEETASSATGTELAVRTTIAYTNSGFDKTSYTANVGEGIEIKNNSSRSLDFASDDHPSHTDNSELNVGTIPAGQTKVFTIDEAGEWGFHNHVFASHEGTITVQ